jgi:N-acetylglucosamine-6-phosphate deacetylase
MGQDRTLAGSDLDMASALRDPVRLMEQDLAVAANMASRNPAAFLGHDESIGSIAPGRQADLVLVTNDLHVARSWIAGRA